MRFGVAYSYSFSRFNAHANVGVYQVARYLDGAALYYLKTLCMNSLPGNPGMCACVSVLVNLADETVVYLDFSDVLAVFVLVRLMYLDFINQFVEKRRGQFVNRLVLLD